MHLKYHVPLANKILIYLAKQKENKCDLCSFCYVPVQGGLITDKL